MSLVEYFENQSGIGVLSTADATGKVDAAIYARPHFMDDHTVAFIMTDRRTHANLKTNPHAVYLFKEDGDKYIGQRLYLTRVREEENNELIESLRRRKYHYTAEDGPEHSRYLVYFRIEEVRPLVGDLQL